MIKCGYNGKGKRYTVTSSATKPRLYNLMKVREEIEKRRRELTEEKSDRGMDCGRKDVGRLNVVS